MSFPGERGRHFMTCWAARVALVTSAEGARPLAVGLSRLGATVVLAMPEEPTTLARAIAHETGNSRVYALALDLNCLHSVRCAAEHFIARYRRLHVLVSDTTVPLGPTVFANLLLDTMKRSGSGRVIRLAIPAARRQIWSTSDTGRHSKSCAS